MSNIKDWLILSRIQSVPVTIGALSVGYGTAEGTILTVEIIPLLILGVVFHLLVYADNDIVDFIHDYRANKEDKPLVSGAVDRDVAVLVVYPALAVMVVAALTSVSLLTFMFIMGGVAMGMWYNRVSKKSYYGALLLGVWGAYMISAGASHSGEVPLVSDIFSFIFGVHMFWMTLEGDIKDLGYDEKGIPEFMGSKIIETRSSRKAVVHPVIFVLCCGTILVAEVMMIIYAVAIQDMEIIVPVVIGCFLIVITGALIISNRYYDESKIKRDIVIHTLITSITILVAASAHMGYWSALVLIVFTIVWGLGWQKALHGSALYFP